MLYCIRTFKLSNIQQPVPSFMQPFKAAAWWYYTAIVVVLMLTGNVAVYALPNVQRLGLKDGLSNSEVRCIFQDHSGYIWFGTYDGLNRFDGYDFRIYRNQPENQHSIIHNFINCIAEDAANNLWVGTRQGISILNPVTEEFSPAYTTSAGNKAVPVTSFIKDIKTDRSGHIFIATLSNGLIVMDNGKRTGNIIPYYDHGKAVRSYNVSALYVGPGSQVYVLISAAGLFTYDTVQGTLKLLNSSVTGATCIYSEGNSLWVGSTQGLHHYDLRSGRYDRLFDELNGAFKSGRITSLQTMPDSTLWVSTDGGGIQILDKKRDKINYLQAGSDEHSLSSDAVYALFLDRDGRKWIGTLRGGINVIDEVKERFVNVRHDDLNSNSLISNFVKSLYEAPDGRLWIGTDGGGLSIWDRQAHRFTNFRHDGSKPGTLSSNFVTSITADKDGRIWIATYGGGIDLYQPGSNTFTSFRGIDSNGIASRIVFWYLYPDHAGNLWASGLQDGLFLYDKRSNQFRQYDAALTNILSIEEDRSGNLWAGNFEGVYKINLQNNKRKFYPVGKAVRSMHRTDNGDMWLGTEAGLMYFSASKEKVIRHYTTGNGLSNNMVLAILQDQQKRLWLSTYNGLCRFDPKENSFTNFFEGDGLASNEFNFNAGLRLNNGELAFGGINGLTVFHPQQILPLHDAPNIVITDIKINNKPISNYPNYVMTGARNAIQSLEIPYDNASVAFSFAAIEFTAQDRIAYRYMLQGWDRGWINAGKQRNALYTRLAPGTYTLKINCTNPEGQWISREIHLGIIILPPWYRTIWAYLIYALLLAGIVYWYLRYKFRETRLKYEVQLANAAAAHQRNLQEKERELNDRRVEFFTGVSHEFRTPLSLIINPLKDLLAKIAPENRAELNIVYRNSRRLLSLVDQLLLFRKADAGSGILQIAPMDITLVCREVFLCFVQQARLSGLSFELNVPEEPVLIYGDREKIEIILFNLISNAIKYTPAGKVVCVTLQPEEHKVVINVIDNGPGIPEETGKHIFEKFYRSTAQGQAAKGGFGIGLFLARQFTTDHGGSLSFESEPGKGSDFCLTLLKGTAHFPPDVAAAADTADLSPLLREMVEEQPVISQVNPINDIDFEAEKIFTDKQRVLVIDDDSEIRAYICSILESRYIIYEASNGLAGLQKAKEKQPDLIICDVMMPGLNGIELCSTIKQDQQLSYIPMILLTASSSAENKIKGLESGADDYISKPFDKDVLIARIANLLQNRSNLQSYFYNTITLKSNNVTISDEYKHFLEKCIEIVEQHITDENFNIKILASEIGMSHSNLYRKIKSLSGHTVNGFIRYIRLRKAAELLIQSDMNVNEVAIETGFNSIKYFRDQFFKLFGANPSDFLKQKRPMFKKRKNTIN
ncbi:Signal transduction histidine kinase [Mucilaginibacter gossypiicola]|uniref:histidine kinase n=1 Tax=Mucilaginibacter gossypiicola TaxID=551995 RepID=A0A1H8S6T1_9SPHI|nr:two-component regulator propeller domain-containing protein [Mucilaginibacter gossypiicola]SEO74322.1 Signal transduction histidine kinase [Mucilaginibacter gossypiicola]